MIRHYGFYPKRMIRHYVIHPTITFMVSCKRDFYVIKQVSLPVRIPLATMSNDVVDLNQSTNSHVTDASVNFIFDHARPSSISPRKF